MTEEQRVEHMQQIVDEVLDKVAKAIFRSRILQDPQMLAYYERHVADNKLEEFVKILNIAIETTWNGTSNEDEMEKKRFRTDAYYALTALGYEIGSTTLPEGMLLV